MKIVKCSWIPFAGYKAITIWPFIIVRKSMAWSFTEYDYNHECIHGRQQLEMLIVGILIAVVLFVVGCRWWSLLALPVFFYWYVVEWLILWAYYRNRKTAYRNIAFEREAYNNQADIDYLRTRKHYAFLNFLY